MVQYWQGVIGDEQLITDCKSEIDKLIGCEYKAANIDQKRFNLFTIRINRADRLVFTSICVNNQHYIVILQKIDNHDYQKSKYLKPQVLKQYLEKNKERLINQILAYDKQIKTVPALDNIEVDKPQLIKLDYFNQVVVNLTSEQNKAVKVQAPCIITGAPGSGKTCVAYFALKNLVEQNPDDEKSIVYIAKSVKLIEEMQKQWLQDDASKTIQGRNVIFLTYKQLALQLNPAIKDKKVSSKTIIDSINKSLQLEQKKKENSLKKTAPLSKQFFTRQRAILAELGLITRLDKETYCKVGERKSYFSQLAEREWLWDNFHSLAENLAKQDRYYLPLYQFVQKALFDIAFVDECQDFNLVQLDNLLQLSKNYQTFFYGDPNQGLKPVKPIIPLLEELLYQYTNQQPRHLVLPHSHRCAGEIIELANRVVMINNLISGGKIDKHSYAAIPLTEWQKMNPGIVEWHETSVLKTHRPVASAKNVIITHEEFIDEAIDKFGSGFVLTIKESKGLEFEKATLYRVFDHPDYRAISKALSDFEGQEISILNRGERGQENTHYRRLLNMILTALTRAKGHLEIYQDCYFAIKFLLNRLQNKNQQKLADNQSTTSQPSPLPAEPVAQEASTIVDWINIVKTLIDKGRDKAAQRVYTKNLGKPISEFNQFTERYRQLKSPLPAKQDIVLQAAVPRPVKTAPDSSSIKKTPNVLDVLNRVCQLLNQKSWPEDNQEWKECLKNIVQLIGVSQDITDMVLTALLQHPHYLRLLFEIPIDASLFNMIQQLNNCPGKLTNLMHFLIDHPNYMINIPGDYLFKASSLGLEPYYFLLHHKNIKLLALLIIRNPQILSAFNIDNIYQSEAAKNLGFINGYYLWEFSYNVFGKKIIEQLKKTNPRFFCKLNINLIDNISRNYVSEGTLLLETSIGLSIIEDIVFNNLDKPQIIVNFLSEKVSYGTFINRGVLFSLAYTNHGQAFLLNLYRKQSKIINAIPAEHWYSSEPMNATKRGSALFYLSFTQTGRKLILDLFNQSSLLNQSKIIYCLFKKHLPIHELEDYETTIFDNFWLAGGKDFDKLIKSLLNSKYKPIQHLPATAFSLNKQVILANLPRWVYFLDSELGVKQFLHILEENKEITGEIFKLLLSKQNNDKLLLWMFHHWNAQTNCINLFKKIAAAHDLPIKNLNKVFNTIPTQRTESLALEFFTVMNNLKKQPFPSNLEDHVKSFTNKLFAQHYCQSVESKPILDLLKELDNINVPSSEQSLILPVVPLLMNQGLFAASPIDDCAYSENKEASNNL